MSNLHAHVSTESADCDGSYSRSHVATLNDDERAMSEQTVNDFHDIVFKARVVGDTVSTHTHGTLTVTPDGVEWSEQTEEGYRSVSVSWCEHGSCDTYLRTQRDHRAESMGY